MLRLVERLGKILYNIKLMKEFPRPREKVSETNYAELGFTTLPILTVDSTLYGEAAVEKLLILSRSRKSRRFTPEQISAGVAGFPSEVQVSSEDRENKFLIHQEQLAPLVNAVRTNPINSRWNAVLPVVNLQDQKLAALKLLAIPQRALEDQNLVRERVHNLIYEAGISARLDHPNIVQTFGMTGLVIDNVFCPGFLMEDLDNMPLKLSPLEVAHLMKQICSAVDYTHRRKFVHLDIKRDNIKQRGGIPVLFDWGAARSVNDLFRRIGAEGSEQYADPQQLENGKDMYNRNDIYMADIHALGMTAYIYLVNREIDLFIDAAGQYSHAHTRPDQRLVPMRDQFDPAVYRVLSKATSYNRADRYRSAHSFYVDLVSALRLCDTFLEDSAEGRFRF